MNEFVFSYPMIAGNDRLNKHTYVCFKKLHKHFRGIIHVNYV